MAWFEFGKSRIYYEEHGEGDPVLLLPGFADSIQEYVTLRDILVNAKYRVVTADLRGSGRSEPQPRQYTATYYADDVQAFSALLRHLNISSSHLIGFSDGGEVVLLMATQTPDLVRSVLTWGAAGKVSDPDGQIREGMHNVIDNPSPSMQSFRDYLIAMYGEANARLTTQSFADAMGAIVNAGGDISAAKADAITCPVLLITGQHDVFAPPELVFNLAAKIQKGEFIKIEGAGHNIYGSHTEWLTQTILDWLKKH